MTKTFPLTGLTCNGCAAKVKNELLKDPEITGVTVSLEPQQAVVSMNSLLSAKHLQELVGKAGHYHIHASAPEANTSVSPERTWLETYKPLLLIFAFITGVSILASSSDGTIHSMLFMRLFMAGFFLVFSFFKLLNVKGFASSYAMYDIIAVRWSGYGFVYPFIELALGISYLINFQPGYTNIATLLVMGISSIGVIQSVVSKKKIRCACLGAVFNLPMSTVTLVEDLLMVAMATVGLFNGSY